MATTRSDKATRSCQVVTAHGGFFVFALKCFVSLNTHLDMR